MPALRLAELHPIVVHFPIALLFTSVVLDVIALFLHRWYLVYGATWLLAFGVTGALAAGLTGSLSAHAAHTAAVSSILDLHQKLGFATGFIFGVLLLARLIWLAPQIIDAFQPRIAGVHDAARRVALAMPLALRTPSALVIGGYLVMSVIGLVLLGLTGYLGGAMVYDHGVGTPTGILIAGWPW